MADIIITESEFCRRYRVSARSAQRWRQTGSGPAWLRLGPRRIGYREADCEKWATSRTFRTRAEELAQAAA